MPPSAAPHNRALAPRIRTILSSLLLVLAGLARSARADCTNPSPSCTDLCLVPLCNSIDQPYSCRPTPVIGANDVVSFQYLGYRPKDFSLVVANGQYHLFYILQYARADSSSTRFGHDVSTDLNHWTALPPVLPVRPGSWDNAHVWAPHVVERDGAWYLFYTGVDSAGKQSTGLAISTDPQLEEWQRLDHPIFTCAQVPWSWCDANDPFGIDFRDPFVMPDPDSTGRWLMVYSTRLADSTAVPGIALSSGDFTAWRDGGPLWRKDTNWWDNSRVFESPHFVQHGGRWFLFYTSSASEPLEFQMTSGSPGDSLGWSYWNRLANLDCTDMQVLLASEETHDPLTGEDLFANVNFNRIEIRRMRWWTDSTFFSLLAPRDRVPPGGVTDLGVRTGSTTAVLHFTAPDDGFGEGRTASYDVRCATEPIEESTFTSAARFSTLPPDTVGTPECVEIGGLKPGKRYWFALRSIDPAGNVSVTSNVVNAVTGGPEGNEIACGRDDDAKPIVGIGEIDPGGSSFPGGRAVASMRLAYPNPFRGRATLELTLPRSSVVTVEIFEPTGRRVRTLRNAWTAAGRTQLAWDGRDADGARMHAGVYLYRWSAGATRGHGKIELLR